MHLDAQTTGQGRHVETQVEIFSTPGPPNTWRLGRTADRTDHATDAVLLIGDLNKTEAIATVNQAHGFGINGSVDTWK